MAAPQTYANHRRFFPLFHFFVIPILALNLLFQLYMTVRRPNMFSIWNVIVAAALLGLGFASRLMALRVQDRLIRLEERMRLQQLLPDDLRGRVGELRTRQLIAMRFCDDAEAPELCRAVLNGEVKEPAEIKRRIKTWKPDWLRA